MGLETKGLTLGSGSREFSGVFSGSDSESVSDSSEDELGVSCVFLDDGGGVDVLSGSDSDSDPSDESSSSAEVDKEVSFSDRAIVG